MLTKLFTRSLLDSNNMLKIRQNSILKWSFEKNQYLLHVQTAIANLKNSISAILEQKSTSYQIYVEELYNIKSVYIVQRDV